MLQAGDTDFQGLILIFSTGYGNFTHNPQTGNSRSCNPYTKGHNKDQTDPASYRGIYLNDTLAKLFEGLLISRLITQSRLSPTLFGTFVADLVHELRAKFPPRLFTLDTNRQTHTPGRGFSVESSLNRISSNFWLWKQNNLSVVL